MTDATVNHMEHMCVLLTEMLKRLDALQMLAEQGNGTSSVEVKYSAATKDLPSKPAPIVKMYAGSEPPTDESIAAYGRAVLLMERAAVLGWEKTVELLERAQLDGGDMP